MFRRGGGATVKEVEFVLTLLRDYNGVGILLAVLFVGIRFGDYRRWEREEHVKIHIELKEIRKAQKRTRVDICTHNEVNNAHHRLFRRELKIPEVEYDKAEMHAREKVLQIKELHDDT
jgi:hypothetical protein